MYASKEEEFEEDSQGNVLSRTTCEDLARQCVTCSNYVCHQIGIFNVM